jgi:hypothetical protein
MKSITKFGRNWLAAAVLTAVSGSFIPPVAAEEPVQPALTRPEMKQRLEALRQRQSRLPLPPPTEAEIASGRSLVNNGRLRSLYLPTSWTSFVIAGWGRGSATRETAGERRHC